MKSIKDLAIFFKNVTFRSADLKSALLLALDVISDNSFLEVLIALIKSISKEFCKQKTLQLCA